MVAFFDLICFVLLINDMIDGNILYFIHTDTRHNFEYIYGRNIDYRTENIELSISEN